MNESSRELTDFLLWMWTSLGTARSRPSAFHLAQEYHMRALASCCLGLAVIALLSVRDARGQTELHRFQTPPGVVVFRSTDPVPAAPMIDPNYLGSTTTYYAPTAPLPSSISSETTVYSPVTPGFTATEWTPVDAGPAVTAYSPVVTSPAAPVDSYGQPTITYYAPDSFAGAAAYPPAVAPIVTGETPIVYGPTVTYQPVVVSPPIAGLPAPPVATVPVGPRVTVRPKVYIQGQPIRNMFRAITP